MIKLCAALLLLYLQHASGQRHDHLLVDPTPPTSTSTPSWGTTTTRPWWATTTGYPWWATSSGRPWWATTQTPPWNANPKHCSSDRFIYSSQMPYFNSDNNFYCSDYWNDGRTPYMRFRTQLSYSVSKFQLRVTVKGFNTRSVDYSSSSYQGFFISDKYGRQYFNPSYDDYPYGYFTKCDYYGYNDCTFTANPNSDVDIIIYFAKNSINSYSFIIEDITPRYGDFWNSAIIFGVLLIVVVIVFILLKRRIRNRRNVENQLQARIDRIPDGPVVSFGPNGYVREAQRLYQPPTIAIPAVESESDKIPLPDGPLIHPNVV